MKMKTKIHENAVSPVVGVMLMLVVTIIIAAVVSAFAGGLGSGAQKAPTVSAETSISNSGYYYGSQFSMVITGVSEPVPTKDVKLVTLWKASNGNVNTHTVVSDGLTDNYMYGAHTGNPQHLVHGIAPWGAGPGTDGFEMYNTKKPSQSFGNYTLTAGMTMRAYPMGPWGPSPADSGGYGPLSPTFTYVDGTRFYPIQHDEIDGMQAVLGKTWNDLRPGDVVNVKLIHIPTGGVMYEKDVAVKGGI